MKNAFPPLFLLSVFIGSSGWYAAPAKGADFVHPGLLDSREELDLMRDKVRAGEESWKTAYAKLPAYLDHRPHPVAHYVDGKGHQDSNDINMQNLSRDGSAAYGSALQWVITGNPAHARKAAEILNAWASTLKSIDPAADGSLSTSYGWPNLLYAAEIIRTTGDAWPQEDQERFKRIVTTLVWDACARAEGKENNHRSLAANCRLAIAVYADDRAKYATQVETVKSQILEYVYPSGQTLETPRDLHHTQMGLAPLVNAAEIAWHQGTDLYSHGGNRLVKATEWHIPFIMADPDARWPSTLESTRYKYVPAPQKVGEVWPFYEYLYNHAHNRMGLDTPNILKLLTVGGVRPEEETRVGGWGTLTHSRGDLLPREK